MYELPAKLKKLVPYEPLTGSYRIRLDANESFLPLPDDLRASIASAAAAVDFNRYPDPYCVELCAAAGAFLGVSPASLVAGNGSDELIGLIVSSFTEAGDTIAVVKPDFSMYGFYAQMCGVRVAAFEKEHLTLDVAALAAFVRRERAKVLLLSNPCNPTSLRASREDVLALVRALDDVLVVIDEAYMEFSDGSILCEAEQLDNVIVLKTCSKAFGMAAIRLGFACAQPVLARALKAAKSPYNVNSMTQAVGCVLFGQAGDYLRDCAERIKCSRDALYAGLCTLAKTRPELREVIDTCANFVFVRVDDPQGLAQKLAQAGIAVRCMPPYLRITAGSDAENAALLEAIGLEMRRASYA